MLVEQPNEKPSKCTISRQVLADTIAKWYAANLKGYTVRVDGSPGQTERPNSIIFRFIGTYAKQDSTLIIPKLYATTDAFAGFPEKNITFIGVDLRNKTTLGNLTEALHVKKRPHDYRG